MTTGEVFQAFFSHAGHDARTDVDLIDHCSDELERRVKSNLVSGEFTVWRDKNRIETGDDFKAEYLKAAGQSQFLIVILSPGWIRSPHCAAEFHAFREVEKTFPGGNSIIPIIARDLETKKDEMDDAQRAIYETLAGRQCRKLDALDFLRLSTDERRARVEEIAQDIERMIARRRGLGARMGARTLVQRQARQSESATRPTRPVRFPNEDFLQKREVLVEKPRADGGPRRVWAQADFLERLYVRDGETEVHFGIHRANLLIHNDGPGSLGESANLSAAGGRAYYLKSRDRALKIVTEAEEDRNLGEMAFPPAEGENVHAEVALASPDVDAGKVRARIELHVEPYDLNIIDPRFGRVDPSLRDKFKTVLGVFIAKRLCDDDERGVDREVEVSEREER